MADSEQAALEALPFGAGVSAAPELPSCDCTLLATAPATAFAARLIAEFLHALPLLRANHDTVFGTNTLFSTAPRARRRDRLAQYPPW